MNNGESLVWVYSGSIIDTLNITFSVQTQISLKPAQLQLNQAFISILSILPYHWGTCTQAQHTQGHRPSMKATQSNLIVFPLHLLAHKPFTPTYICARVCDRISHTYRVLLPHHAPRGSVHILKEWRNYCVLRSADCTLKPCVSAERFIRAWTC